MKHLIKTILREEVRLLEDVATSGPNFKVTDDFLLDIGSKKYELQTEQKKFGLSVRIGIDIVEISEDEEGGISLTVEIPITRKRMTNKIRKSNVDKVVNGAANNEDEIMVKNLDGKEFYLVRV